MHKKNLINWISDDNLKIKTKIISLQVYLLNSGGVQWEIHGKKNQEDNILMVNYLSSKSTKISNK